MKNIAILSILLSILFFLLLIKEKKDYVAIEYYGDTNKLFNAVFISKEPMVDSEMVITVLINDYVKNFMVDNREFLFIKQAVKSTLREKTPGYNGFIIRICESDAE